MKIFSIRNKNKEIKKNSSGHETEEEVEIDEEEKEGCVPHAVHVFSSL